MKFCVICAVILTMLMRSDALFGGLFKGCFFIENNIESVYLDCNDFQKKHDDNCSSTIEGGTVMPNVKLLKISACELWLVTGVNGFSVSIPAGLNELDVSNNRNEFVEIFLNSFSMIYNSISRFNASDCQLTVILKHMFDKMPKLIVIDLSYNEITQIDSNSFQKLNKLKTLNLSSNELKALDSDAFSHLESLENLDLSSNTIKMADDTFDQNVNLKTLSIDDINSCAIFRLLSQSDLVEVKYFNIFSLTELNTNCEEVTLEISVDNDEMNIEFPETEQLLEFDRDDLKKLYLVRFGPGQLKDTLNVIEMLGSSIVLLVISGNFIGQLKPNTFAKFSELSGLFLDNTNISKFDFDPFENLTKLHALSISNNNMEYLNTTVLKKSLANLTVLILNDNNLKNLDEVINCLGMNVQVLGLRGNPLAKVNDKTFAKFKDLLVIDLDRTNLEHFHVNWFNQCKQLQRISISDNKLNKANFTLPPNQVSNLIELYVDENSLLELIGLNNQSYPRLKFLSILGNPMTCEYVTKLNEQWTHLDFRSDRCNAEDKTHGMYSTLNMGRTTEYIPTPTPKTSSTAVYYSVPISIAFVIIVAIAVAWYIRQRHYGNQNEDKISEHIYEEIGPPTNDPSYNRLDFRDQHPNNALLVHYDNAGVNRDDQIRENDSDRGKAMGIQLETINPPYDQLNLQPPNNKILDHYNNYQPQPQENRSSEME